MLAGLEIDVLMRGLNNSEREGCPEVLFVANVPPSDGTIRRIGCLVT